MKTNVIILKTIKVKRKGMYKLETSFMFKSEINLMTKYTLKMMKTKL